MTADSLSDDLSAAAGGDFDLAAEVLEAAAVSVRSGHTPDAARLLRRALAMLGIFEQSSAPQELSAALMAGMPPALRGMILHQFRVASDAARAAGDSPEDADRRGAEAVREMGQLMPLAPAEYRAALFMEAWHLESILTPEDQAMLDAIGGMVGKEAGMASGAPPFLIISLALTDFLRALAPRHPALPAGK